MNRLICRLGMVVLLSLPAVASQASDCTVRKDSFGQSRYRCDDGRHGTLRTDSFGNVRDTGSDKKWRKDSFGNWRSDDGAHWRKDSFGNWRASDGSQCRQDSFGNWRCHGEEAAPPAVYDSDDDEDELDVQDDD